MTNSFDNRFESLRRQEFRDFFQPSRIALGVIPEANNVVNVITLCFNMHCSYKPPMMAFSIQKGAYSHQLIYGVNELVLAIPGENLAEESLYCGTTSGREADKVAKCGLTLVESQSVSVPGIAECIANVELQVKDRLKSGDHVTVFGEVKRFAVDRRNRQRPLLSVGAIEDGFDILAKKGIHRIGVVKKSLDHPMQQK